LTDCGVSTAQPVVMPLLRLFQAFAGGLPTLYDGQDLLNQWRVVEPAVGLPFMLLQITLVSSAAEQAQASKVRVAAAGISTALLFYIWFYYWTAAVSALLIALILDRPARPTCAAILGIGVVGGAPSVAEGLMTKARLDPQALTRIGVFAPVPRFAFFLVPKAALLALVITGLWVWRRAGRECFYLWCLALAALALSNNHVVSGMDLRAGHWRFVWGTALTMLVLLMAAQFLIDGLRMSNSVLAVVISAALIIETAAGLTLRTIEVERSVNTKRVLDRFMRFVPQAPPKLVALLPAGSVIAGDEDFYELASIVTGARPLAGYAAFLSLELNDRQWETREALNAHLKGLSEAQFRREAQSAARLYGWRQSAGEPQPLMVEAAMMREFVRTEQVLQPETERLDVGYIALRPGHQGLAYLAHGWSLIQAGPYWQIWKREQAQQPQR
jgi:hypothetical protein